MLVAKENSPGEALGQLSQAIERIQIWTFSIPRQRLAVQLNPVYRLYAGLIQVAGKIDNTNTTQTNRFNFKGQSSL